MPRLGLPHSVESGMGFLCCHRDASRPFRHLLAIASTDLLLGKFKWHPASWRSH
ncbi:MULTISPECIES: hypothetical protein [Laspinema]|uniref:Uncharacterized protein n=1 Tax=Laspinema olomoucense D3b TaxID=2953688 RepID=A0ABT2NCK7_9CYAN|nr:MULTISPECIES: hypothetical protein [unclassified Laspinema]MCT7980426.1 hypothetical protein [Laspinema sp. D3b]